MKKGFFISACVVLLSACVSAPEKMGKIDYTLDQQMQRGDIAYREARLTDAENIYRTIVESHPQMTDVWFRLGNIYTRKDELDAAVRAYETVIRYRPDNGAAWYNLSLVHLKSAVDTLEMAERNLPRDSQYLVNIMALRSNLISRGEAPTNTSAPNAQSIPRESQESPSLPVTPQVQSSAAPKELPPAAQAASGATDSPSPAAPPVVPVTDLPTNADKPASTDPLTPEKAK